MRQHPAQYSARDYRPGKERCGNIPRNTAPAIIGQVRNDIAEMQELAANYAATQLPTLSDQAKAALRQTLTVEIDRLEALAKVNSTIRQDEITFFRTQREQGLAAIDRAALQLQGLRLIVST
jgi:ATP-dependent helicase HepA